MSGVYAQAGCLGVCKHVEVYVYGGMCCIDVYACEWMQHVKCVFCMIVCGACMWSECLHIFLVQSLRSRSWLR